MIRHACTFALAVLCLFPLWRLSCQDATAESDPAQSSLQTVLVPEPSIEGEAADRKQAEPFAESLRSSLVGALGSAGFKVLTADADEGVAAWVARCSVSLEDERLAYRVSVAGRGSAELVAADSFSAYAGPTAFPLIDNSAKSVAAQLASYVQGSAAQPRRPVPYRIRLLSPDNGATVTVGPPEQRASIVAGRIKDNALLLPYYPFVRGSTIRLYVSASGRRTESVDIALGIAAPEVRLPPLKKESYQDLLVGTGTGRLLGAGAGYRRYLVPDWSFLFVQDNLFTGYDFTPGSSPLLHEEVWMGFGSFLVLPPESRFRFGAGIGLGYLLSVSTLPEAVRRLYFDFALMPVYIFSEYRFTPRVSAWLSLSSGYALDTGTSGLLSMGWMGDGAPALGAGASWHL